MPAIPPMCIIYDLFTAKNETAGYHKGKSPHDSEFFLY